MRMRIVWLAAAGVAVAAFLTAPGRAGSLTPPGPPGATMRTLEEVFERILALETRLDQGGAPLPRTGQATSYGNRDDGDLQTGMGWPEPRFTDHGNNTVTDRLTGLMWVKVPHSLPGNTGTLTWANALNLCNLLEFAGYSDWRLPNALELASLQDVENSNPSLPTGHPFTNIQSVVYWSSTTAAQGGGDAYCVSFGSCALYVTGITTVNRVWPVRGGR